MRCPSCGAEVPGGHAYCTNCGASMPRNGVQQAPRRPYNEDPGPGRGGYDGYGYDGYDYPPMPAPEPQRSHAILYVLIGFLSVLLIAIGILIVTSMNKDKDKSETDTEPEVQTVVVTPTPTAATPVPETPTPTPVPTPAYSAEDEAAVKAVIGNYVNAYVADLNDETYSRMYGCVQAGSAFETERRNWINQNAPNNLRETVLDYQVTNVQRQNANSYYVTSVEKYSYYSDKDPSVKWVQQQCVYQVDRQSDGSWKISNLIGNVNVLGRGDY